jgi:phage N-6-adenine-methyltransferase
MASTSYETPAYLYNRLNAAYGPFDLDAAAGLNNKKCPLYLNKQDNALEWTDSWPSRFSNPEIIEKVWLNPPWGPKDPVFPWVRKAVHEISVPSSINTICMLLPWGRWASWHEFIIPQAEMVRVIGRIPFLLNGKPVKSPPACNVVAVLRRLVKGHRWPIGFTEATIDGRK